MKPYLQDADCTLYYGDALAVLRELSDESVHCIATSPPFYALRDYGTGRWEGGEAECDHKGDPTGNNRRSQSLGSYVRPDSGKPTGGGGKGAHGEDGAPFRDTCGKCGATRIDQQIGLESTPEEWAQKLVEVFREARRVLVPSGSLWIEVGDSYAGSWGAQSRGNETGEAKSTLQGSSMLSARQIQAAPKTTRTGSIPDGSDLKPKDLIGTPWLLAFALRADGWSLRGAYVWSKSNAMPESAKDRCTTAHSMVFHFAKCRWSGFVDPIAMPERDAAWLAAMIDGEGTICFQERGNRKWTPSVYPRLSIVNTDKRLIDRVAEITGIAAGAVPSPRKRGDGSPGRPMWTWQMVGEHAVRVISAIRPHLISKGTQADLAIYVQKLNMKHKGRGGHRTTDADLETKRRAAAACSELNHGRVPDLSWFAPIAIGRWVPQPYHFDGDAISEPLAEPKGSGGWQSMQRRREQFDHRYDRKTASERNDYETLRNFTRDYDAGKAPRSVWSIPTQGFPEAHFATWPEALARRIILAGCPEQVCSVCGEARVRIVESHIQHTQKVHNSSAPSDPAKAYNRRGNQAADGMVAGVRIAETIGYTDCGHASFQPGVVLDPFSGSGTTLYVARKLGRRGIGIDLNESYLEMAARRLQQQSLFAQEAVSGL